jgi:pimeloyl-ACP methyl ester carboxylesterase
MASGGWIAYSHFLLNHQRPLPKAIPAEQITIRFAPTGPLSAYFDRQGDGRPLLLIHSINAAASAYEMRPLFQHYRGQRPTLALDLPGYGFSARPKFDYTPEVFVKAILAALQYFDGEPADVVALSLGSEFAAAALLQRPNAFRSLALISPTGFNRRSTGRGSQIAGQKGYDGWLYDLFTVPLWARPFYDVLTTRRSIEYFLQKSFVGAIPPGFVDYAYATSHQPGAEHAPLAFVTGRLFTPGAAQRLYANVTKPTLVLHDRDAFVSFDLLPELLGQNPAWHAERIAPTLGLPHFERLAETTQALDRFWQTTATT